MAEDLDLYGILEVAVDATDKELVRAYRKKARKCHPDKNPDNPRAAEEFHELTKALEVLTDAAARAAYDKALKAKKAAELRHRELDSKRKKLKDDLDSRERSSQDQKDDVACVNRNLQHEIERLRKEGSRLVEEEQAKLADELKKEQKAEKERQAAHDEVAPRLRVRWQAKKGDPDNGGYSRQLLTQAFSKYGEVSAILVSTKKSGSAVVEFESTHSAVLAIQMEIGLPSNPLTLTWLSGQPDHTPVAPVGKSEQESSPGDIGSKRSSTQAFPIESDSLKNHDFESLVFHRMRQAEERKRLIEQLKSEDTEDT